MARLDPRGTRVRGASLSRINKLVNKLIYHWPSIFFFFFFFFFFFPLWQRGAPAKIANKTGEAINNEPMGRGDEFALPGLLIKT